MFEKIKKLSRDIINLISSPFRSQKLHKLEAFDYEKLSNLMKEKGTLQEFEEQLKNFDEIESLMQNKTSLHGINHVIRVVFNAYALITLENINPEDKKIIVQAARLHDIGRIYDGEDKKHGQDGAIRAEEFLKNKGFSEEDIHQICFLIKEHSLPREKNLEDINNLPSAIRDRYQYNLSILKDADKLDRCRLGDLDISRLSNENAKRLIEASNDNFEQNRYHYHRKTEFFPVDEENAKIILQQLKSKNEKLEITLEDIKKDYNAYKLMQDENKLEWISMYKGKIKEKVSISDFVNMLSKISKQDMEYLDDYFDTGKTPIILAINDMGINKFSQLKENNQLHKIMHFHNHKIEGISREQLNLLLEIGKYERTLLEYFYMYYLFVSTNEKRLVDILILSKKEQMEYINKIRSGDLGYKIEKNIVRLPPALEMAVIKNMDHKLVLGIRDNTNLPLNIILLGLVDLEIVNENVKIENIEKEDVEKLLINYHRLYLNVSAKKDKKQLRTLLLDLPDELTEEEKELIRRCTIGNLKRFKLDSFEQVKNYQKVCDKKILDEFKNIDSVDELRTLIIETKMHNLKNVKRDLYFYEKYFGEDSKQKDIVNLFKQLFEAKDKETLLDTYNTLNNSKTGFEFDEIMQDIRKELEEVSKKDVVQKMHQMQVKIKNMKKTERDGTEVIDLTGTDFNLLISVIGSMGSPYITHWRNRTN